MTDDPADLAAENLRLTFDLCAAGEAQASMHELGQLDVRSKYGRSAAGAADER